MKILLYALLVFGMFCEFFGVFIIIDSLRSAPGQELLGIDWPVGLCTCLLGTANVLAYQFLKLRIFPPKH